MLSQKDCNRSLVTHVQHTANSQLFTASKTAPGLHVNQKMAATQVSSTGF